MVSKLESEAETTWFQSQSQDEGHQGLAHLWQIQTWVSLQIHTWVIVQMKTLVLVQKHSFVLVQIHNTYLAYGTDINLGHTTGTHLDDKREKQAGAELGQAQLKLGLDFTLIFCRFGLSRFGELACGWIGS